MLLAERIDRLRSAIQVLTKASEEVIKAWESEAAQSETLILSSSSIPPSQNPGSVPSHELYKARNEILGAAGVCIELVHDPQIRLLEVAFQIYEARALHIVAEKRVADIFAEGDQVHGTSIAELSKRIGIKDHKLARLLRTLCSTHVFSEVSEGYFGNNVISEHLAHNEALRAYIMLHHHFIYDCCGKLPEVLSDPTKSNSESNRETAFQVVFKTNQTSWEWFKEPIMLPDGSTKPKPVLELFSLAMVGAGRAQGQAVIVDYPWAELGSATIVDVGGGIGGMSMDLARNYPKLKFIVQDLSEQIEQAPSIWEKELPAVLEGERVKFMIHNFLTEQPVKNAEIYFLRYIMHDYPDDVCIKILSTLRPALGTKSRILICDQVTRTTCGSPQDVDEHIPYPLPANYGFAHRYPNMSDLNMMTLLAGRERTVSEYKNLAKSAGLQILKLWKCRGTLWVIEMGLPPA
ncbi:S-adenosyl-L-methionine-dependent methyltransferase [Abortiporus biennis]|nr:S-adenosyl-L-methionine-dependent methyltransferase [Abortiporus biennis]